MKSPFVSEVERHLDALAETASRAARELAGTVAEVAEMVLHAIDAGGTLFFCGNGGSAADAQHLATEYVVRFRRNRHALPAVALTTDTSLLTAASNDFGFEHVFARQVRALAGAGDILFLHSTSGRSPNLLEAARAARDVGARTVALLGGDGGPLREAVDVAIVVPTADGAHAQELHLAIGHAICDIVESRLAGHGTGEY
ncbi:MAG TPA: SIS domain-containing protein [Longimicrobiales bacterium]